MAGLKPRPTVRCPFRATRRRLLLEPARLGHQLLDRVGLHRQEPREVLVAALGDQDHVLEPDVHALVGYCQRRLDGEDHPRQQHLARRLHVVHFDADHVAQAVAGVVAVPVHERLGRLAVRLARKAVRRDDAVHLDDGLADDVARRDARLDRGHQRLVHPQVDGVALLLVRREVPAGRKHPRDVRRVVAVVGRVVEEHQLARLQLGFPAVVVRVVRVLPRRRQREVREALRAALLEDVVGDGLEVVLPLPGPRAADGLGNRDTRQARRLAHQRDLARALDEAQVVEDRTKNAEEIGAFKTPTLREISRSAPYMHDGRFKTLDDVVNFYNQGGVKNPHQDPLILPLELTKEEKQDLVQFLRTLTGEGWKHATAPTTFPQ